MTSKVSYSEGRMPQGADVVRSLLAIGDGASFSTTSIPTRYNTDIVRKSPIPNGYVGIAEVVVLPEELVSILTPGDLSQRESRQMTRDELNAKLAQNKAEVESVAAAMRTEMANFRTAYVESFKDISITLNKLDAKSDATEKRLTQAQWIVSLVISISAVTLSAVIYFSNKTSNKPVQQQPTVIVNSSPQPEPQLQQPQQPRQQQPQSK